jgi:TonB family protein
MEFAVASGKMAYAMNIAAIQSEWIGRVIDARFPLLQWIGGSESAGVFVTEIMDEPWRKAAIKLIAVNASDAESQIAVWERTAVLSHPHLMPLLHTGRCRLDNSTLLYSVTDYSDEVLSQILPERPLAPREAAEMLGPLADALSYLHSKGFVHGHLKPNNILVVEDRLKLSIDGLQVAGALVKRAAALSVYDAPEAAGGVVSAAADVWSLGITLVESLTQYPPVWDRSNSEGPIVPRSLPQPFFDIARDCLRIDPARRCTLNDIKVPLEPAEPHLDTSSPVPPEPAVLDKIVATSQPRRRGPVLIAAALVLIAIVAVLVVRHNRVEPGFPTGEKLVMKVPAPEQPERAEQPEQPEQPESGEATPTVRKPSAGTLAPAAPAAPAPIAVSGAGAQSSNGATVKGEVPGRILPDILPSASESIHGQVNVAIRVTVDSAGNVTSTSLDSPGPSKYFAKVALESAKHWTFKAAKVNGNAVASIWILHYQFTHGATNITPVETYP